VDVALIYIPDHLQLISYKSFAYESGNHEGKAATRSILYASFRAYKKDTLHVFINHWPSRYGGKDATKHKRADAARLLKRQIDSIISADPLAKVIVMGDFNDDPDDDSLWRILNAGPWEAQQKVDLVNLFWEYKKKEIGTVFHTDVNGRWYVFDQIIVSKALLSGDSFQLRYPRGFIFRGDWLIDSETKRPYRSFRGPVFVGGYSDHLPVYADFMQ
jgi:hypothetical protein